MEWGPWGFPPCVLRQKAVLGPGLSLSGPRWQEARCARLIPLAEGLERVLISPDPYLVLQETEILEQSCMYLCVTE